MPRSVGCRAEASACEGFSAEPVLEVDEVSDTLNASEALVSALIASRSRRSPRQAEVEVCHAVAAAALMVKLDEFKIQDNTPQASRAVEGDQSMNFPDACFLTKRRSKR
jgi:hypothetical protein